MIIGNGLLARAFAPRYGNDQQILVFASGVSNSMETDAGQFQRERNLLQQALAGRSGKLVYFSSCGVANAVEPLTPYMRHKREMELLVSRYDGGLVLRLPQVVGKTCNPHTLTNYLRDRILSGERFTVWKGAERNLVDVDDVLAIARAMLAGDAAPGLVTSIAAERSMPMPEIVRLFENVLGRKANYETADRGSALPIDASLALQIAAQRGIDLGSNYAERVIGKYYAVYAVASTLA